MDCDVDVKNNPWSVSTWNDFLYFCCPECNLKDRSKDVFIKHAIDHHPKAQETFYNVQLKDEPLDEKDDEAYVHPEDIPSHDLKTEPNESEEKPMVNPSILVSLTCDVQLESENTEELFDDSEKPGDPFETIESKVDDELNSHDSDSISFNCDICENETFESVRELKKHTKKVHGGNKKQTEKCDICHKVFSKLYIKAHKASVHDGIKTANCEFCGKFYSNSSILRDHIKTVHEKLREFMCHYCNKDFGLRSALRQHISAIHEGSKFVCDHCGKEYSRKNELNVHVKTFHKGIKEYHCDQCGKTFGHSHVLSRHVKSVHQGLKAAECPICHRTFTQKQKLKSHIMLVHEKLRPHVCDYCGLTFTKKEYLKKTY